MATTSAVMKKKACSSSAQPPELCSCITWPVCTSAKATTMLIAITSAAGTTHRPTSSRSEEHTSELQSPCNLVCRLLLEKKKHALHQHRLVFAIPIKVSQRFTHRVRLMRRSSESNAHVTNFFGHPVADSLKQIGLAALDC